MHVTIVGPAVGRPAVALHGLGGSTEQNLPALEAVATHYGLRIHATICRTIAAAARWGSSISR